MSSTFPYVTSAAALPTDPPRHVVDAGYYDNYGVNLAAAWICEPSRLDQQPYIRGPGRPDCEHFGTKDDSKCSMNRS